MPLSRSNASLDESPDKNWMARLFEAIDDGVFVHDHDGNILEANTAVCRRLGYRREEFVRMNVRQIDAPEFAANFEERLREQRRTGRLRCEGVHRTKDGRAIHVDIHCSAIEWKGTPAVLAVMRDITQKRRADETRSKQGKLLRSILETMGEAIFVVNSDLEPIVTNEAAERLFGLDTHAGLPIFLPDRDQPWPEHPLARCLRGESFDDVEMRVRTAGAGSDVPISAAGRPLRDSVSGIKGAVLVAREITERKLAQRRLTAQYEVARALASANSISQAAVSMLEALTRGLGMEVGVLWVVDPAEQSLCCQGIWKRPELEIQELVTLTRRISLKKGADTPGLVWKENRAVVQVYLPTDIRRYDRTTLALQQGLEAAVGFPLRGQGEPVGVLEFLACTEPKLDDDLHAMMSAMGSQIGQFIQRQRAEAALRDSEALYQSLVERLPQSIFRKDREGRITYANQRLCEKLQRSKEEIVGKTDFDLFRADLAAQYVKDDQIILRHGKTYETVEMHQLPDGASIWVQVVKTPLYDAEGQIVGVQGIFWDVTEKKQAEENLAASERRYRQLAEATIDGVVLSDENGRITLFNPAAERMFGWSAAEAIGKPIAGLLVQDLRSLLESLVGRSAELTAARRDGSHFPVEVSLSLLGSAQGAFPPMLAAFRDLTERNKIRSALVQSEKLASIGLLSAGVAHEINNPLAFIANNLVVLERDGNGIMELVEIIHAAKERLPEDVRSAWNAKAEEIDLDYLRDNISRILNRTREGVDRVSRIVHSLRGMARTDPPRLTESRIPTLVDASLEILAGRFKRSGIEIQQQHDPEPSVLGVSTQLNQVLLNLLINAFQAVESHRKEGGVIRIVTRREPPWLILEISDNGPGIPAKDLTNIFDPFFTTKDVGEGTGLGLWISHQIVSAHGGRIEVESQSGQGALFRLWLPIRPERMLT
jgi:two-component system NtrC family sensor kinase